MKKTPVLIIGAGPSGLMMACELARHQVDFRIIDKKSERTLTSNATWLQTRSIEIFDEMGIVDRFLHIGHICKAINVYAHGRALIKIALDQIDSLYQFVLMLPQSETERILTARLEEFKHAVERPIELVGIKRLVNCFEASVNNLETNTIETIVCDWLVACDGANSAVREAVNISFPGDSFEEQFVVADAQMDSFLSAHEIHVFFDKGTVLAGFPLGVNKYRLSANLHLGYPRKFYTEKEVKEVVIDRTFGDYNVESVSWISPFWIHNRFASAMRDGGIFLVGDAAHIHSPAGGQGMNTGIHDAYNLAWKLALVIKNQAKPALLDTYMEERFPVVKDIVNRTERFTKIALLENSLLIKIRNFIYRILDKQKCFTASIANRITQLSIRYLDSSIIHYKNKLSRRSPQPGTRAPDVLLTQSKSLRNYLRNVGHHVLLFTGKAPSTGLIEQIKSLQSSIDNKYDGHVTTHIVSTRSDDNVIPDMDFVIHDRYHLAGPAIYLLRPDNYIAYCSGKMEWQGVDALLSTYLNL